ncbi:PepSY domain-containing protein [Achromobacter xylosoxidans]
MSALPQTRPRAATGPSLAARAKRWLYLLHRWAGITLCLFFAMWFISGVVMMYVGYPKLTPAERLGHLAPLDPAGVTVTPAQALAAAGLEDGAALSLSASRAGQAVYLAGGRRAAPKAVDAASGALLPAADERVAAATASAWFGGAYPLRYAGAVAEDVYTHSRALDQHPPLHRVDVADPEHTRLYISSATGAVVLDATRAERAWNYVGAWIHWLYPFRGNALDRWWHDIVVWLSVAGVTLALTGTVVGLMRWRFSRPYASGSRSPYRENMMRWHHLSGLLFAVVTITWIFSGLMSMNPWKLFASGAAPLAQAAYEGPPAPAATLAAPAALIAALPAAPRELSWTRAAGQSLVQARMAAGAPLLLSARERAPPRSTPPCCAPRRHAAAGRPAGRGADAGALRLLLLRATSTPCWAMWKAAAGLAAGLRQPRGQLGLPGSGHRTAHRPAGSRQPRQPLAVRLPAQLGLDRPAGAPPLWDALLIFLSLGGAALSLTGVVIGWRRLGKKLRH